MSAFFNVVREPAQVTFNGVTQEINKDVLLNEDSGDILGVVSKQYALVQNNEVKDYFDEAFDGYKTSNITDHLSNNTGHWIREIVFDDPDFTREIVPSDVVNLKLKIWNGYNGLTSVGYALEGYRQICKNGMMGWRNMFSTKLPHWGKDVIGLIKDSFSIQFQNYQIVFDRMEKWATEPFNQKDFGRFIDSKTKVKDEKTIAKFLSDKQSENIKAQFPIVMNRYNENETKWGSFNVLTHIATHDTATKSSSSHLFTHGYKRMEKLATSFVEEF
jgi:hypothetical protein